MRGEVKAGSSRLDQSVVTVRVRSDPESGVWRERRYEGGGAVCQVWVLERRRQRLYHRAGVYGSQCHAALHAGHTFTCHATDGAPQHL